MSELEIVKINPKDEKKVREFINFPFQLYSQKDNWTPQLKIDQKSYIFNGPYLNQENVGIMQPFLAYKDGKLAGRIIAHYNQSYNRQKNTKKGLIGFFDSINNTEVSNHLFKNAELWLKAQGMTSMHGPLNYLIYDPSGILIKGFEKPSALEISYNHPYYQKLFEEFGFEKDVDWHAYEFHASNEIPETFYKIKNRVQESNGFSFRTPKMKDYYEEVKKIRKVFNLAWAENQGHFDLSKEEFNHLAKNLKIVIKPELAILAEKNNELVGFIVSFPDISQGLKKANGKIFPGAYNILKDLRTTKTLKTMLMGVHPEYRGRGLDAYLILETIDRAKKMGFEKADMSLIVDTNQAMKDDLEKLGAKIRRTYRFYKKDF